RWELAAQQLQEALRLDDANVQFRTNLSNIYLNQAQEAFRRHQTTDALDALNRLFAIAPSSRPGQILLGDIEYGRQRLKEAKAAWNQAKTLGATERELGDRLERVTEELPVESNFERLTQAYFDLRYEEQLERPVGFDIRDALLEARRTVGSDFAYWPKHKLVVLIYSAESFRKLRQETPEWVGGQFDGKIRMPLPSGQLDTPAVKAILFHEYTHALIEDLTGGRCPTWLNEGLADYEAARHQPRPLLRLREAHGQNHLVPWSSLSEQFSYSLSHEAVSLGYEQSYSIAHYLVQRYGFWRVRRALKTIHEGTPWETALTGEFRIKLPKLEAAWRAELPEFLTASQ
ncbi:MAG: hypothetical protein COV75_03270, partial [Candidatus Omnitrophica bacterium CG11_big_fil_rev_8_21_14_0_20_63_9]